MAGSFPWVQDNWFSLVQTAGILAGLLFTAWSFRRTSLDQRTSNRLSLAGHHRELWECAHQDAALQRIFATEPDLVAAPVTFEEREFLLEVIYHFQTCLELAREGGLVSLRALRLDAATFFGLPIPRAVWRETRASRDPRFVTFIEECLKAR